MQIVSCLCLLLMFQLSENVHVPLLSLSDALLRTHRPFSWLHDQLSRDYKKALSSLWVTYLDHTKGSELVCYIYNIMQIP